MADGESYYKEKIEPLVKLISDLCADHEIYMIAVFQVSKKKMEGWEVMGKPADLRMHAIQRVALLRKIPCDYANLIDENGVFHIFN